MSAILVVDDEFDIADTLEVLLVTEGFAARTASDGQDALEQLLGDPPDLVITDIMMPRMSGVELIAAMREDGRLAGIPVLAMSAAPPPPELVDWATPLLRKPFTVEEFLSLVSRLLETSRKTRASR